MEKKKRKLILAFIPTIISLILAGIFLYLAIKELSFVELAFYLLFFIFLSLACAGIRPIFWYFNKIRVLEYVEMRYNKLIRLKDELYKTKNIEKVYKNKDGTPTIYVKESVEALNELGYKGDSLIDMLYDNTLTIEEILTPIDMLIDETVKPFKGIPYQFLMLVR